MHTYICEISSVLNMLIDAQHTWNGNICNNRTICRTEFNVIEIRTCVGAVSPSRSIPPDTLFHAAGVGYPSVIVTRYTYTQCTVTHMYVYDSSVHVYQCLRQLHCYDAVQPQYARTYGICTHHSSAKCGMASQHALPILRLCATTHRNAMQGHACRCHYVTT
jgi:hypothetical protein